MFANLLTSQIGEMYFIFLSKLTTFRLYLLGRMVAEKRGLDKVERWGRERVDWIKWKDGDEKGWMASHPSSYLTKR